MRAAVAAMLVVAAWTPAASAAEVAVRILDLEATAEGRLRIQHSVPADHYFILLGGTDAARISTPLAFQLSGSGAGTMEATLSPTGSAFFQVRAVPESAPLDLDGDGMDDRFELLWRPLLNALDPADAHQDPDGDGLTTFEEYLRGTDPSTANALATTFTSSPAAGEADVAVTRETTLYFSSPLSQAATPLTNAVYATFGGRRLLTRLELSGDRRKASLFYQENLPGSARVQVTVDGDLLPDAGGRKVDADRDGMEGGKGQFHFDTVNLTAAPGVVVVGQVFASELATSGGVGTPQNRPLAGVTITVDGREQDLRAVTDAEGRFTLSPAPIGTFFVHIDGRTAVGSTWPGGAYYPFVGKAWDAAAGRTNLAGGTGVIYLPLIPAGALQAVSASQPTSVQFTPEVLARNPELAGVEVRVPANALFNDSGTRGGRVGIAPVPRDRLPSPLPPGLDLPLVITVQTDGPQNFDQPVPVRFPNTPDPITGKALAPGEKSALWSFDHDTGRWGIVGPMTVSADGRFVETDPGVGLRQPGWHGQRPGTTASPPPGPPPPNFCDKVAEYALSSYYGCAGGKALAGALKAAGGMTIDAVGSTLPGESVVAMIAGSAGTYVVREGTFGDPGDSARDALDYEGICCACLASSGVFGSAGCGGKAGLSLAGLASAANELQNSLASATGGGAVKFLLDGLNQGATQISRLELLTKQFVTASSRHLELAAQARALVGNAKRDSDLPAATLAQVLAIHAEITALLGNRLPADFYGDLLENMQKVEGELMQSLNIPGSGPGYFLLENLTTGTVQRGRTDPRGGLPDLILPPSHNFRLTRVDAASFAVSISEFGSARTGFPTFVPRGFWLRGSSVPPDTDGDGLNDLAEKALGTLPSKADSDNDGISDATELTNGSDPLGGLFLVTGVIGSADTPGNASDIAVQGSLAAVADGTAGVTLFDVSRAQQPVAVAQIDTPGNARGIAMEPGTVFVADGSAGLTLINTREPARASVTRTIGLGAEAIAVTPIQGLVAVGLADGRLVILEPGTGRLVGQRSFGNRISDLAVDESGTLWVATGSRLHSVRIPRSGIALFELGSAPLDFFPEGITGRRRVSIAEGRAYVTSYPGYLVFDTSNPAEPIRLGDAVDRGPNSFKQMVPLSPTLGVAAVGINPRDDGTHDLWLFDLSNPAGTTNFLAELRTPGIAHSLALHRGRALVADGAAGLQVVNPVPADTAGVPPTVSLVLPISGDEVEEGAVLPLAARATDDVLVARVEFLVNGEILADDGAYPFATPYVAPALSPDRTSVRLRARATDTGGNSAWSEERVLRIVRDRTPPQIEMVSPPESSIVGETRELRASFSEALETSPTGIQIQVWALAPGQTVTDAEMPGGNPVPGIVAIGGSTLAFRVTDPLPEGRYLVQIERNVRDRAGNALSSTYRWQFLTLAFVDADADGVPDNLEASLGLNPTSADTNGNGVPDGEEDFDRDGVPNAVERIAGFDPRNPNSKDPAIVDGRIDTDLDGLANWREVLLGTRLDVDDTDGDGWPDGVEAELQTLALNNGSFPRLFSYGGTLTTLGPGPSSPTWGGGRTPTVTAAPLILSFAPDEEGSFGRPFATPSVAPLILLPGIEANGGFSGQPIAQPPTSILLEVP